jgi:tryptophan synthase alpha chain
MTRYAAMFEQCRACGKGALGAFLMLGDPDPESCLAYLDALVAGGADMVEVGIPFSDPVADGPVIQAAAKRALEAGVRPADALAVIAKFRRRYPDVPLGVLTYANIVAARGTETFAADLAAVGADSLLVADVPQLEARSYANATRQAGIDLILIAAGNTPDPALQRIASMTSGYTYCVARVGVTGTDTVPQRNHRRLFERLSLLHAPPPVLGFGISTSAHVAEAMAGGAAGVIVGSAIVDLIGNGMSPSIVSEFVSELKERTGLPQS